MKKSFDRIKETGAYQHADVWTGGGVGTTFQAMEKYPEAFESATDYAIDIPAAFFEEEINSWNGDKLIHAMAFYSLSRGVMKATDRVLDDPSIYTKACVSFAAVTGFGGWKELEYDNYPDPIDMAANYAGWITAVGHEKRLQDSKTSLEEAGKALDPEEQ